MRACSGGTDAFSELRALADALARLSGVPALSGDRTASKIVRIALRLGATAVPLLGRELRGPDAARREVARRALVELAAGGARTRVVAELQAIASGRADDASDEAKVCALGLLAELGEHAAGAIAHFRDAPAMRRRSAIALAAQLESAADIASAADLMLRQLPHDDVAHIVAAMVEASPAAAARLGRELAARLDAPPALRARVAAAIEGIDLDPPPPPRPVDVAVLIDASARIVVVASTALPTRGRPSWRRWAVLVGASGRIDDCIHEDDAGPGGDPASIIASLCADGYRVASSEADHARTIVAAAARRGSAALAPAYYLGRDLLELGDAHLDPHARNAADAVDPDATTALLGRAVELVAEGDPVRARGLLERCDPANADVAAALAACLVAEGRAAEALAPLERARAAEPAWPLHAWNLAALHHQLGDVAACYHALRGFLAACDAPSALAGDPDHPARIACAHRMVADLERRARLAGTSLAPPPRRPSARRKARPPAPSRRRTARPVDD